MLLRVVLTSLCERLADLRDTKLFSVLVDLVFCKVDFFCKVVQQDLCKSLVNIIVFLLGILSSMSLHCNWLVLDVEFIRDPILGSCPQQGISVA